MHLSALGHDLGVEPTVESDERPWGRYVALSDAEDHKVVADGFRSKAGQAGVKAGRLFRLTMDGLRAR